MCVRRESIYSLEAVLMTSSVVDGERRSGSVVNGFPCGNCCVPAERVGLLCSDRRKFWTATSASICDGAALRIGRISTRSLIVFSQVLYAEVFNMQHQARERFSSHSSDD